MKVVSAIRLVAAWALLSVLMAATGLGQSFVEAGPLAHAGSTPMPLREPEATTRVVPRADLGSQRELEYVGSYCSDGKFRALSRLDRLFPDRTASASPEAVTPQGPTPAEAPPSVQPGSNERLVEDFEPPGHAVAVARGQRPAAGARDAVLRFVYGRGKVLRAPRHLTADSDQRLILSDPALPAIHVLDPKSKRSFRIVGGPGRRLQLPSGVAVDAENNIYVADSERGVIFVYGPDGIFLRAIGDLGGGEGLFRYPTSIAIDRKAGRLYVLDSPRLLMLDLQGKVLKRVGRLRGDTGEFSNPKDIVLSAEELLVLDMDGARVQIMDLECNLLRRVGLSQVPMSQDLGVGVDQDGDIYVSFADASVVKIYNHDGALVRAFGGWGTRIGQFNSPTGLWVDSTNRIYVADTRNVRVQVFQLFTPNLPTEAPQGSN